MAIWHQMWPIWVSMERAIQMQHSDRELSQLDPPVKNGSKNCSMANFPLYFFKIPLYLQKLVATPQKWSECHQTNFGGS